MSETGMSERGVRSLVANYVTAIMSECSFLVSQSRAGKYWVSRCLGHPKIRGGNTFGGKPEKH